MLNIPIYCPLTKIPGKIAIYDVIIIIVSLHSDLYFNLSIVTGHYK